MHEISIATQVLSTIGFVAIVATALIVGIGIATYIQDIIEEKKWMYKYKHRFDKEPKAQCYCKDCDYFDDSRECPIEWKTPETGFCWKATPCSRKENEKREKNEAAK